MIASLDILSNKYIQIVLNSRFFDLWKSLAIGIGIFVLILFLKNIFTKYIIKGLEKIFKGFKIKSATAILNAFEKPIRATFIVVGIYIFISIVLGALKFDSNNIKILINKCLGSILIILFTIGLVNVAGNSDQFLTKAHNKYDMKVNTVLIPTICKGIKILIILFSIIQIANIWGIDVNAFITGIGLSGVVVALAAKDFAANMISGAIIFMDSPFTIGDWIKCNQLEGTVEEISFRSTRIRTFDKALISVPNSVLANEPIFNYNKRDLRRVNIDIGVTYDTTKSQLEKCSQKIKTMLMESEEIDSEGIIVNFDKFGDSSLDISIYYFIRRTAFNEYMDVKEKINYEIMKILDEEDVQIAFPSRTLYIEQK